MLYRHRSLILAKVTYHGPGIGRMKGLTAVADRGMMCISVMADAATSRIAGKCV
jgi:hypothetical protein